jgi:hypothetical protein
METETFSTCYNGQVQSKGNVWYTLTRLDGSEMMITLGAKTMFTKTSLPAPDEVTVIGWTTSYETEPLIGRYRSIKAEGHVTINPTLLSRPVQFTVDEKNLEGVLRPA